MVTTEEYRIIPDYPLYEVSSLGNVRSWNNKGTKRNYPKQLKPCLNGVKGRKYFLLGISSNGKQKTKSIHRLVLTTFIGPCPAGMEACHNNGISTDNRLENLRWDTHAENMKDRMKHTAISKGYEMIRVNQISLKAEMKSKKITVLDLANKFNMVPDTLSKKLGGYLPIDKELLEKIEKFIKGSK